MFYYNESLFSLVTFLFINSNFLILNSIHCSMWNILYWAIPLLKQRSVSNGCSVVRMMQLRNTHRNDKRVLAIVSLHRFANDAIAKARQVITIETCCLHSYSESPILKKDCPFSAYIIFSLSFLMKVSACTYGRLSLSSYS
jgi:hypothetical protein